MLFLLQIAWTPVLAALSIGLQDNEDTNLITLCLDGMRCAIRVACVFQLQVVNNFVWKTRSLNLN